jgi:ATP synthase protein I
MVDDPAPPEKDHETAFSRSVAAKLERKLRQQGKGKTGVWYGLGMTGLIGWSVVLPTIIGATLGHWWDRHHPGGHSWTLALMVAGLFVGCANAWHWVLREDRAMHEDSETHDE